MRPVVDFGKNGEIKPVNLRVLLNADPSEFEGSKGARSNILKERFVSLAEALNKFKSDG